MCDNNGMETLLLNPAHCKTLRELAARQLSSSAVNVAAGGLKAALVLGMLLPLGACTTIKKDDHSYSYIYQHNATPPKQVVETVTTRETRNRRYTTQDDFLDQPNEPEIPWPETSQGYPQDDYSTPPRYRPQSNVAPSYVPSYAPVYVQPSYDPPVVTPYYRAPSVSGVAAAAFYLPAPSINLNFRSGGGTSRHDSSYPRTGPYSRNPRTPCGVVNGGYTPPSGRYSVSPGGRISSRSDAGGGRYSLSGRVSFGGRN